MSHFIPSQVMFSVSVGSLLASLELDVHPDKCTMKCQVSRRPAETNVGQEEFQTKSTGFGLKEYVYGLYSCHIALL